MTFRFWRCVDHYLSIDILCYTNHSPDRARYPIPLLRDMKDTLPLVLVLGELVQDMQKWIELVRTIRG